MTARKQGLKQGGGLVCLPDTKASTLHLFLKDILTCCNLPLSQCCGQAYYGAANMPGKRKGVGSNAHQERSPSALPVHCLAHSLNLCLQYAGRQVELLRDVIDIVTYIECLI